MMDDIAGALRAVLRSPARLRALMALGPALPYDLVRFLVRIVPQARASLAATRERALAIPDTLLRAEAVASVDGKAYHVAGACILATFLPEQDARSYIEIVSPLETIYDYLDNLCDRHPQVTPEAFPVLHRAIADALDPTAAPHDYYACGPTGDDGGYLRELVRTVQTALATVPNIGALLPHFREAASLYGEMQTYKHLPAGQREIACVEWYERHRARFSELDWHEFACAAGSQFQVYGPLFSAFCGSDEIDAIYDAYFPAVSAIHVLLDSFIDREEDRAHGELNFADVYGSAGALRARIGALARTAWYRFGALARPYHHRFVLNVMMLFYLSHPKIATPALDREARAILRANGMGNVGRALR